MFTLDKSAAVAIWAKLCHRDPQADAVCAISRTSVQSTPENHYFLDVSAFTLGVFLSYLCQPEIYLFLFCWFGFFCLSAYSWSLKYRSCVLHIHYSTET